jgi:protein-S-isoprenylcysteine O-methyltransferase Ste14
MLFIPSPVIFLNFKTAIVIGLIVSISGEAIRGITIGLAYIIRAGKNRRIFAEGLLTNGLYAHCRNPLYIGNIMILLGLGLIANSLLFLIIFIPVFIFFYHSIVLAEENFLRDKFGEAYVQYQKQANRWFPKLKGLGDTFSEMTFKWKRVFIEEYNSTFLWMTGAVLLIMKNLYQHKGKESFLQSLPVFLIVILCLILLYFTIRYLKKSGIWKGD